MPVLCSLDIYLDAKLKCPQGQKHENAGKSAADGDIMESCSDKKSDTKSSFCRRKVRVHSSYLSHHSGSCDGCGAMNVLVDIESVLN